MILVDATALQSEHRTRGVGAYVRELVTHTESAGRRLPWYVASTVGPLPDALPKNRTVPVLRPHRPAQMYWLYNELALRTVLARLRPRVFLAPDFNGLVRNPFGATVAVLHDLAQLKLSADGGEPSTSLGERLSDLRWRVYHRKLATADLVIARSESVKRDAVELLHLDPARIVPIAQGLDVSLFTDHRHRGRFAGALQYFVHVGAFNANKNQARLLSAFARADLGGAQLLFAGPWGSDGLRWLSATARKLGVDDRVRHLGYVPDGDLPSLYGNAVAVVFPSLEEGYGLPVLEGMASGAPVITSDRSSMPEVAGSAALLVDPQDVDQIASAMTLVLRDEHLRGRLSALGLARAAQFSWARLADAVWAQLEMHEAATGIPREATS